MQIAQIIQNLALMKHESPDLRVIDLYSLIRKETVVQLMEDIFSENKHNSAPFLDVTPFIFRDVALFTEQEIRMLVSLFEF